MILLPCSTHTHGVQQEIRKLTSLSQFQLWTGITPIYEDARAAVMKGEEALTTTVSGSS